MNLFSIENTIFLGYFDFLLRDNKKYCVLIIVIEHTIFFYRSNRNYYLNRA